MVSSGIGEDIHVSEAAYFYLSNSTDSYFNLNINGSCLISPMRTGLLDPNRTRPLLDIVDLWRECDKDPANCNVSIYNVIRVNNVLTCGSQIGKVILDVDKGIKSIYNFPSSEYQIVSKDFSIFLKKR